MQTSRQKGDGATDGDGVKNKKNIAGEDGGQSNS